MNTKKKTNNLNSVVKAIREKAKRDFFFFAKDILGYDKLTDVHREWCNELEDLTIKRRLDLEPRGTYKSTLRTVAYTLWRLIKDVNLRVLITSANQTNADGFLREMVSHMRSNRLFNLLFGDWINPNKWTQSGIIIQPRTTVKKDMTIACAGANSNVTGKHFDIIICDDIVNHEDRDFERFRERKKMFFEELISVLEPDGWLFVIGTRWHFFDLYSDIMNEMNPKLKELGDSAYNVKVQSAIDENGNAVFPDILPLKKLDTLRIEKRAQFYSQYLNNPLPEGAALFLEEKMHFYDELPNKELSYFGFIDPAVGESANSSRSALIVLAKDEEKGTLFVADVFVERINPDKALEVIFKYNEKYHFSKFGYETNMHLSYWFKKLQKMNQERGVYIPLIGIQQRLKKEVRIESLEPLINDGTIRFLKGYQNHPMYRELMEELLFYPRGKTLDAVDALESATRVAKAMKSRQQLKIDVLGESYFNGDYK